MSLPTLTANTPSVGSFSWTAFHVAYGGAGYSVAAGSSSKRFVWWRYNDGSPSIQESDTQPTLQPEDLLLFLNRNGVPVLVPATQVVDGSLIVDGSVVADALAADSVSADKIAAGAVDTVALAAGAVTADELAANAVTADKLAANSVTADAVEANAINGMSITGNTITGATITGSTLRTGNTGNYVSIDSNVQNRIQFKSANLSQPGLIEAGSKLLQILSPWDGVHVPVTMAFQAGGASQGSLLSYGADEVYAGTSSFILYDRNTHQSTDLLAEWEPWTPTITGGFTVNSITGRMMRVGKTVHLTCEIVGAGANGAGFHVGGMPLRQKDTMVGTFQALNGGNVWTGFVRAQTSVFTFWFSDSNTAYGAATRVSGQYVSNGWTFSFSATYEAA